MNAAGSRRRLISMLVVLTAGWAAIAGRLVWVQGLASGRFSEMAAGQRERRVELPAQRGSIVDRNGSIIAISLDHESIFANPRFVADPKGAALALAPILKVPAAILEDKLSSDRGFVYLARKLDRERAGRIKALGLPGIDSHPESKRFYPLGPLAAQTVGFVGLDNNGLSGLEARFDSGLAGKPGEVLVERDPKGRSIPSGEYRMVSPVRGTDLRLTIDRDIQYSAESALAAAVEKHGARSGSVVVMSPRDGDILALASYPTFDPNNFERATADARRNRPVMDVYEPGSASKVVTVAAALESGAVGRRDVLSVPDKLKLGAKVFQDSHPHPPLDLTVEGVLERSSNVGTIKVALQVGKETMHSYLQKFGIGRPTGLGLPGEARGILPELPQWWATSLPTIAIGQGVAVTPVQMASVYSTIANGGVRVQPRLVLSGSDAAAGPRETPRGVRVIRRETAAQLTAMLVGVIENEEGTGRLAAVPGYRVAGKTGTAQRPSKSGGYEGYMASFMGFAPAQSPELVVGVVLEDPEPIWGGVTAAPVFQEVMQFGLRHLGIGPGPVLPKEGSPLPVPGRSGGPPSAAAPTRD